MLKGLLTGDSGRITAVPLQKVEIRGEVIGLFAEFGLTQIYNNNTNNNLEIIYTFPLPDRTAVTGFSARTGTVQARGEVRSREDAFAVYDEAVRKGNSAFLLEQFRPNVFQVSLGQLGPGEEAEITISYLQELRRLDNELRITIPTLVAPRYIPGKPRGKKMGLGTVDPTDRVPDADFISPPIGGAGYTASLDLLITPFGDDARITSPSHKIVAQAEAGGRYRVTLAEGETPLDRDIVISCRQSCETGSYGVVSRREDGGCLYLELLPTLPPVEADSGREYIFLLDISGSMAGEKLAQAKTALKLCLRNLTGNDTFNIVAFESDCHFFSADSRYFRQESLEAAGAWIDSLEALGGTEILEAVAFALRLPAKRERVVLLFTDGQVGDEKEIIAFTLRYRGQSRLFTFGIDTAVNEFFINALAEAGNGTGEFVYPGERLEDKVLRQFARIISPAVSQAAVDWGRLRTEEVFPAKTGPVFDLEPIPVIASFSGEAGGEVILHHNGRPLTSPVDLAAMIDDDKFPFLEKLFVKKKTEALANSLYNINPRRAKAVINEIVALCRRFGLASDHTSFVAVLERENKVSGLPDTVVVPTVVPAGWRTDYYWPGGAGVAVRQATALMSPDVIHEPFFFCQECVPEARHIQAEDEGRNLRQLAQKQLADGSFGQTDDSSRQKALATSLAVLAFTLDDSHLAQYGGQLRKAVFYLLDYAGNPATEKDASFVLAVLAVQTVLDRGLLRGELRRTTVPALAEMKTQISVTYRGGGPGVDYLAGKITLEDLPRVQNYEHTDLFEILLPE
jgi:Ca-activated chloride channel family protein